VVTNKEYRVIVNT